MSDVKLLIVFYSTYGTNLQMAKEAEKVAIDIGAEVRLRRVKETAPEDVVKSQDAWVETLEKMKDIQEVEPEDMAWANAYLFSSPTRYGGAASQMRAFIDTLGPLWQEGKLANKPFSAMTSAQNIHGGQETTIQTLYITAMHWGAVVVTPGYTSPSVSESGGNPYGVSVTVEGEGVTDKVRNSIKHQVERLVSMAEKLLK